MDILSLPWSYLHINHLHPDGYVPKKSIHISISSVVEGSTLES